MTDLAYVDVRPVLAKVADLERELVLVGGQAVNFWASYYELRVPELAADAPFTSKDIDFCGDQRAVGVCAERLGGTPRVATFDDATPNSGTVVFVDGAGVMRTLDVVSAPYGLDAAEVHATALPVEILDDARTVVRVRGTSAIHIPFTQDASFRVALGRLLSRQSVLSKPRRGCPKHANRRCFLPVSVRFGESAPMLQS